MTKRKTKATGLARTSGQDGKLPGALPAGYTTLLADLKARVRAAQLRAVVSVNRELILLYWDIGKIIVEAQQTKGYGKQVVERLAEDLQKEFPGTAGFSPQNVWYMRSFYLAWTKELQKLQQPVGESTSKILPHSDRRLLLRHCRICGWTERAGHGVPALAGKPRKRGTTNLDQFCASWRKNHLMKRGVRRERDPFVNRRFPCLQIIKMLKC
jgi:hypothetical protein